jgi:hypothetical protein
MNRRRKLYEPTFFEKLYKFFEMGIPTPDGAESVVNSDIGQICVTSKYPFFVAACAMNVIFPKTIYPISIEVYYNPEDYTIQRYVNDHVFNEIDSRLFFISLDLNTQNKRSLFNMQDVGYSHIVTLVVNNDDESVYLLDPNGRTPTSKKLMSDIVRHMLPDHQYKGRINWDGDSSLNENARCASWGIFLPIFILHNLFKPENKVNDLLYVLSILTSEQRDHELDIVIDPLFNKFKNNVLLETANMMIGQRFVFGLPSSAHDLNALKDYVLNGLDKLGNTYSDGVSSGDIEQAYEELRSGVRNMYRHNNYFMKIMDGQTPVNTGLIKNSTYSPGPVSPSWDE